MAKKLTIILLSIFLPISVFAVTSKTFQDPIPDTVIDPDFSAENLTATVTFNLPLDGTVTAGQMTIDQTSGQVRIHDGTAERVFTYEQDFSFSIPSTTLQNIDKIIPVKAHKRAITITDIACRVQSGTSVVIWMSDGTNDTETITCATTNTEDDGTIANGTFSSREQMFVEWSTITGTVDWLNVEITYVIDAD